MAEHDKDHEHESLHELIKKRDSVFARFPLLFTMLGTFGVVTTLYGLGHLLDHFPLLANKPIIPLLVGIFILVVTGQLYKRLN